MSAQAAKKREPAKFDEAVLAMMAEPITVRVNKKIAGREMPLSLPLKEGETVSGVGWGRDDCRTLGDFLVNEWSGGGLYDITFTDSQGTVMRWEPYWPPERYPEKTPPTMMQGASSGAPPPAVMPSQAPQMVMPMQPASSPRGSFLQTAVQQYVTPPPAQPGAGWGVPQNGGGPQFGGYQYSPASPPRYRDDDRYQTERERVVALEARMVQERQEAAHQAQLAALQQEIRRIAESSSRRPDDDRVRELERQLSEDRRAREMDDRIAAMQAATAAQIAAIQQSTQQQLQALQQTLAQLAQRPSGPDPIMMLLIESQKAQAQAQVQAAQLAADAQKEVARAQADAAREAARTAIGPRELMELVSKAQPGTEQITSAVARVLELNHQAIEQALQLQSPGMNPLLQMAGEAAQGGLALAQRYLEMKEKNTSVQAQAQVQSAAIAAQAQVTQHQLAGSAAPPKDAAAADAAGESEEGEDDEGPTPEEIEATEKELFGAAYPEVMKLRKGVASGMLKPQMAAQVVVQGINQAIEKNLVIPAFALWQKGEFLKLVEVLVPDAQLGFKDQMGAAFVDLVQQHRQQPPKKEKPAEA